MLALASKNIHCSDNLLKMGALNHEIIAKPDLLTGRFPIANGF